MSVGGDGMFDSPCRYCIPPKRREGCHGVCGEYANWRAEKNVEAQNKCQGKEADAVLAEKARERKRRHYRRGGKY